MNTTNGLHINHLMTMIYNLGGAISYRLRGSGGITNCENYLKASLNGPDVTS